MIETDICPACEERTYELRGDQWVCSLCNYSRLKNPDRHRVRTGRDPRVALQWTCPVCGSHRFESSKDGTICHGYLPASRGGQACGFRDVPMELSKHSKPTGGIRPRHETGMNMPRRGPP